MDNAQLQFFSPRKIITGIGSLDRVAQEIKGLGGTRVLVVTDPGIMEAGLLKPLLDRVQGTDIAVEVFDDVNPDPELARVEACTARLKEGGHDLVIGFGGGSPIDVAKYSAVLVRHPGKVRDYLGRHMLERKGLPMIMIPTTAGTGSEVTWAAVFHDEADHVKKAVWSPFVQADTVIVDPSLTLTMPKALTIDTGMDALVHALEAYVAVEASHLTDALAFEAVRLITGSLRQVVGDGNDLQARYKMSVAATISGLAFCNAGLGAIHALALLLDGEYGFTHGRSLTVLAPTIMAFNLAARPGKYAQIARALGRDTEGLTREEAGLGAIAAVQELVRDLGIPARLRDYGIQEGQLEAMGRRAFQIGQRLLPMNPRPLEEGDSIRIYQDAY